MPWLPHSISTYGGDIDRIIVLIAVIVGAWFVAAEAILLFFALRWRKRQGRRASYLPGLSLRALGFVFVPAIVVLALDLGIDAASAAVWTEIKINIPPADQTIRIIGKQFVWRFIHPGPDGKLDTPDDIEGANNLHVRLNEVVRFELQSEDVVHSFFVPNLRLKQDAVPGRTIHGWFKATEAGDFMVSCAELCGLGHNNMLAWLHVDSPETYQTWMAENAAAEGEGEESP